MTAALLTVKPTGILDVSGPPKAAGWTRVAGYLTDAGLAILTVLALPALIMLVATSVELLARAVIAIIGRVF